MSETVLDDESIRALTDPIGQIEAARALQHAAELRTIHTINFLAMTGGRGHLQQGAELLSRLSPADRSQALGHPNTSAWALYCNDQLPEGQDPHETAHHLHYYGAIAAAAIIGAGRPLNRTEIPIQSDNTAMLPGIGRALFAVDNTRRNPVAIIEHTSEGILRVQSGDEVIERRIESTDDGPQWQRVRHLTADAWNMPPVELDDISPYRHLGVSTGNARPAERLPSEAVDYLQGNYQAAQTFLGEYLPQYQALVRLGLRSIVPLVAHEWYSHTRSSELGVIGLSMPPDPQSFATALAEELPDGMYQTLHRLFPLHINPTGEPRYGVPNEDAPVSFRKRLAIACSHGVVIDTWAARYAAAEKGSAEQVRAQVNYARLRDREGELLAELYGSPMITKTGRIVLDGLMARADQRPAHEVHLEPYMTTLAHTLNLDQRVCWQLRNLCPDQESVSQLASRWIAKLPLPSNVDVISEVLPDNRELWGHYERAQLLLEHHAGKSISSDHSPANQAFANGQYEAAYAAYKQSILEDPAHADEAWAGFALLHTWVGSGTDTAAEILRTHPEVVRAVYEEIIQRRSAAEPGELAAWLGGLHGKLHTMEY